MRGIRSFAIFDLETTGIPQFNFNRVYITELSICGISTIDLTSQENVESNKESTSKIPNKPRVLHKLNLLFNPRSMIRPEVERITGLSNYNLEHESALDLNAATMIVNFLKHLQQPVCLVAHNGWNFDFPIFKEKLSKFELELPKDLVCVDSFAAFLDIDRKREKLHEAADNIEEPLPELDNIIDLSENSNENPLETVESPENKDLYQTLQENDKIDWQAINETTPKSKTISKTLSKMRPILKRRLTFSDTPDKLKRVKPERGQYKLGNIYKRVFSEDMANAHEAEADVVALTKLIQHYGGDFVSYSNKYARAFEEIIQVGRKWEDF